MQLSVYFILYVLCKIHVGMVYMWLFGELMCHFYLAVRNLACLNCHTKVSFIPGPDIFALEPISEIRLNWVKIQIKLLTWTTTVKTR